MFIVLLFLPSGYVPFSPRYGFKKGNTGSITTYRYILFFSTLSEDFEEMKKEKKKREKSLIKYL